MSQSRRRLDDGIVNHLGFGSWCCLPQAQRRFENGEHQQTADHSDDGHEQRRHQPVPYLEMRCRHLCRAAQHRSGDKLYKGFSKKRRNTDDHDRHDEDRRRQPQARSGIMRLGRIVIAYWAKEHMPDQAETIGC